MPKLIIGLVGQAGCGKGTATDLLRKEYGAGYIRFSGILGEILEQLSIEKTRENFIKLSEALRNMYGQDVLSFAVEKAALSAPEDIVVVDGIRRPDDIVALEPLPQFKLISIDVAAEQRFERMKKRGEKATEANMTWEQFLEEEKAPTEITIPAVMDRAWRTIKNEGSKEEFEEEVRQTLHDLGFDPLA
ncbi:AAA family ATPase [Patescibacteria group bacterium]|jgi:dephospho-CoA kinase|nr:AAA family ATPase [Patescibacteria group bacterium]